MLGSMPCSIVPLGRGQISKTKYGYKSPAYFRAVPLGRLGPPILFRGVGIQAVWVNFIALAAIGGALFSFSLARLRKSLSEIR